MSTNISQRNLLHLIRSYIDGLLDRFACEGLKNISEIRALMKKDFVNTLITIYSSNGLRERLALSQGISASCIKALTTMGFKVLALDAILKTHAIFGTSQGVIASVVEVGMSWDHIVDLPVIPSSSIKGSVRGIIEYLLRSKCPEEQLDRCLDYVRILFGEGGHEGWASLLLFFDAYPIDVRNPWNRLLEPDIVSPHYMHGTEVRKFERLVEPVPVPHVSIAPGVVFRFVVAAEPSGEVEEALKGLMECFGRNYTGLGPAIASLLLTAFRYGIGARTSRGYGKFEIVKMDVVVDGNKFSTPILFEPSVKRRGRTSRKGGRR